MAYISVLNLDLRTRTSVEFSIRAKSGPHILLNLASGRAFLVIIGYGANLATSTIRRGRCAW